MRIRYFIYAAMAIIGLVLLLLNLSGFVLPLRHPELATAPTGFAPNDVTLSAQQVLAEAQPLPGESNEEFAHRLTLLVNQGMAHYWYSPDYNIHVPAHENWLLWLSGMVLPGFDNWEYIDHRRALERGVGLCSQHAVIMVGLLREAGVNAQIVNLDYHVIARVEVAPDTWYVADADYGVLVPYDYDRISPAIVRQFYHAYPDHWEYLGRAYQQTPSQIAPSAVEWRVTAFQVERASYWLKWGVPGGFLLIGMLPLLRTFPRRKRSRPAQATGN
jgi:hypothetical protein